MKFSQAKKLFALLGVWALSVGFSVSAVAHHSGEMFEREKTVTLTGVVKEFRYINPHLSLIHI